MVQANTTINVLTVSELTHAIRVRLESTFPRVYVKGEITNLKQQSSGHLYFTIKDTTAQLACVMFRLDVAKIQVPLKIGDHVLLQGEITVYPAKGNYQLIVREISLLGLGELLARLEMLKQKLAEKGYFDPARKKKIPPFPKRIGVVTSPTGAVIRDIINVLTRRLGGFHLILNPVRVQGDGADIEIAKAIGEFNTYQLVDVLIVCRGGGSLEDLMPFNSEKVAAAIFHSDIPVISAVGHETDTTISDFVADLRAPTPSAAAEIVSSETNQIVTYLEKCKRHIEQVLRHRLNVAKEQLQRIQRQPLFMTSSALLGTSIQRLDGLREHIDSVMMHRLSKVRENLQRFGRLIQLLQPSRKLQEERMKLRNFERRLDQDIQRHVHDAKRRFDSLVLHVQSLNPKSLLQKGYSILFSRKTGSIINSISAMKKGDDVRVVLSDGEAEAHITDIYGSK